MAPSVILLPCLSVSPPSGAALTCDYLEEYWDSISNSTASGWICSCSVAIWPLCPTSLCNYYWKTNMLVLSWGLGLPPLVEVSCCGSSSLICVDPVGALYFRHLFQMKRPKQTTSMNPAITKRTLSKRAKPPDLPFLDFSPWRVLLEYPLMVRPC
jgi:hypothetical protein